MKFIIILLTILIFVQPLFCINKDAGTTAFNFLMIPLGPRGAAMGNAYYGLSNDELAPFWNPAGLGNVKHKRLSVSYLNYFDGYNGGSASFVMPMKKGSVAIFSKFAGVFGLKKMGIDENQDPVPEGKFNSYDVLIGLSYGSKLSEIMNIGLNLKIISETIDNYSSQALAADIAILHQTPNPRLKIGLVGKNFGKQLTKFYEKDEKLPQLLGFGVSYRLNHGYITLDINKPLHYDYYYTIGFEHIVYTNLTLRAGYRSNASDWKVGSNIDFLAGLSAGFGFVWNVYIFNYSINSFGELGFVHQFSVGHKF